MKLKIFLLAVFFSLIAGCTSMGMKSSCCQTYSNCSPCKTYTYTTTTYKKCYQPCCSMPYCPTYCGNACDSCGNCY